MLAGFLPILNTPEEQADFAALYARCGARAMALARRILKDAALAEDAVHDGFAYLADHYQRLKDGSPEHVRTAQRIIFYATQQLESLAMQTSAADLIVCDRGTVDAAVYWPEGIEDFFASMGTTLDEQIARYDAVIHLSPPLKAEFYQSTRVRTETLEEASRIDRKILKIWEKHPNRMVLPSMDHFFQKAGIIKDFIDTLLPQEEKK